ncbi:MAG: DUF1818 family protein [Cyanobacteria bacterium P01_H01_bin.15]
MSRMLKQGVGWRLGYDPSELKFCGLMGTADWAVELTRAELADFRRLLLELVGTLQSLAKELMPEEKIEIEAESDLVWLAVQGQVAVYELRFILQNGERRCEGHFPPEVVPELIAAIKTLEAF